MTTTDSDRDIHASLAGVTRVYPAAAGTQPVHALGPVDLDLRRGEFFAVVGPSGCGKSTLLEVLAGLQRPTAGTVTFEGHPVASEVPDGIGVVFQEDASFPWLTVWDNAAFGLRRNGVDSAEIRRRVDDTLGFMGLMDFARAYPAQLSGGMRQRVCIARTLVLQPRQRVNDGAEHETSRHRDQRSHHHNAESADDLVVDLSRNQETNQRVSHLRRWDHDAMIDQTEPGTDFEEPDRDHKDRNPHPGHPAHSAAVPE